MKNYTRRTFSKKLVLGGLLMSPAMRMLATMKGSGFVDNQLGRIRLGGPVFRNEYDSPESWVKVVKEKGYSAANCPVDEGADDIEVQAYENAAREADIIIAEVGAWSNPIHPDDKFRKAALDKCSAKLELADRIGARCCVNVSGSRGTLKNGGPHPDNYSSETFDLIVESVRKIIDAVKPRRTFYALETMPYALPDSIDSYLELIKAIDRKGFAAHFDPVNLINSPRRYFNNASLIKEGFQKLGKYIRSCHAKDSLLSTSLTTHLDEVVPGLGKLDYRVYLHELALLEGVPLMMEHMEKDQYPQAAAYIKHTGAEMGLRF